MKESKDYGYMFRLARIPGYGNESPHRVMADAVYYGDLRNRNDVTFQMRPVWGSAASYYRVRLWDVEEAELGWWAGKVQLEINAQRLGGSFAPFSIYVAEALAETSMLVKFPEYYSPDEPRQDGKPAMDRGMWLLTGWRMA